MHEALRSVEEVLLPLLFGQALGALRGLMLKALRFAGVDA